MKHQQKAWLVAYDIRAPRRLRRVHRLLRKEGVPAQYSVFTVEANDPQIVLLLAKLRALIDESSDDLRAYHLPATCPVWSLGTQHWPNGVCLSGTHAARLLHAATTEPIDAPDKADAASA
jgi:CRISPR-associated protein Cas2